MKHLSKYCKILTLGASKTEEALVGDVILQEKVDGSMFRFGLNEDKKLLMGSHQINWEGAKPDKMFNLAADYVTFIGGRIKKDFSGDTYFFCEYLSKPKHNVLKYSTIPTNGLVLFDAIEKGKWYNRPALAIAARQLGIDLIPQLYKGEADLDLLNKLLDTDSYLGNEKIEGVVIKNYNKFIEVGGHVFPLFTKFVNEKYRERHMKDWKDRGEKGLNAFFLSFKTEARWEKALQHLKEEGKIAQEPKDIGAIIKEVQEDIKEEERENIEKYLYSFYIRQLNKVATAGVPNWYKKKLLENLK